jgi:hypothetical protein
MADEDQRPSTQIGIEPTEQWERWTGSTTPPEWRLMKRAKVDKRGGVKWITFPDTINGVDVIVEMPENAPTKSCHENRHDHCPHRLGGPHEGGHVLKAGAIGFCWRCGCPCHRDPHRAGRLF